MRGCLIAFGVLGLLSSGLGLAQGRVDVPPGPQGLGFMVGYVGLPLGLLLMGLFGGSKAGSGGDPGAGSSNLSATSVPRSWKQLSPVTKVAVGCLGAVVVWIGSIVVLAIVAQLSGAG